jgi:hypothetical protein
VATDQGHGVPGLLEINGAILRPTRQGEKGVFAQVCGVFGPDLEPVPLAETVAHVGTVSLPVSCPDPASLPTRTGRWLFGGIGFLHFGHALIFSAARLWALDHLAEPPDGILFFDRGTGGETRSGTGRNLQAILALLGIDLPVVTLGQDERVERLILPEQGISTSAALFPGTDRQRAFLRRRLGPAPGPLPTANVFVSRVKLGHAKTGLMFEDRVETLMAAAGYRVFHPERASLAEQLALYHSAARIVGVDGSALHLAAFAAPPSARVALLARRPFYPEALASQVRAVSGARAHVIRPPVRVFRHAGHRELSDAWTASYALPAFPALRLALVRAGMLAPDTPEWPDPSPTEIAARLALISRRTGRALVAVPPDPPSSPDPR